MARTRLIRPAFFKHGELYDAEVASGLPLRVAFAGLWTVAERPDGRFAWKPRELKTDVLPHDPVDFADVLDALERYGFIVRYAVDGKVFGCIPSFPQHQTFHKSERPSSLPPPPDPHRVPTAPPPSTGMRREDAVAVTGAVAVAGTITGTVDGQPQPQPPPGVLRTMVNGKRLDPLQVSELVQQIRRLAKDQRSGPPRILRTDVESLGAAVVRAYDALGGSERFVATKPDKIPFLIRDFGEALELAQRGAP